MSLLLRRGPLGLGLAVVACLIGACSPSLTATPTTATESVVGGSSEAGYASVGYLLKGNPLKGPSCGVTLIDRDVAVTAGHCIAMQGGADAPFGVRFDAAGSGPVVPVARAWVHPAYATNTASNASDRTQHDIAVLILQRPADVAPAVIDTPTTALSATYVGYGRTTPGTAAVTTGYTGARKSATERITSVDTTRIFAAGVDGGLCWGDSGGPLMVTGTNRVVGVLSDFDGKFDCEVGDRMIFTSLTGESAFIAAARSCGVSEDGACVATAMTAGQTGATGATGGAACRYACRDYGYQDGDCNGGWSCDGDCLTFVGADACAAQAAPACAYPCSDYRFAEGQCYRGWQCLYGCLEQVGACFN